MNCVQDTKHAAGMLGCFFFVVFFFSTCFLSLTFSARAREPSKLLGLPAPGRCWHQAPKSWGRWVAPRLLGIGAAAGLPFACSDTEGNQVSFWGVAGCLSRDGSRLSGSSLCTSHSCRVCEVCRCVSPGTRAEGHRRAVRGGHAGPVGLPQLCAAAGHGLGAGSGLPETPARWGAPVTSRTCGRLICTWSCDNTNVVFSCFFTSHQRCLQSEVFFCNPFIFT